MGGAAEATLEELLKVNQAMASTLQKMAGGVRGGGGSSEKELEKNTKGASASMIAAKTAGFAFGATISVGIKALNLFAKGVSTLTGAAAGAANAMVALAEAAVNGDAGFSALSSALSKLPGPFGIIGSLAGIYGAVLEKNIKTHEALSKSGATFGGDLDRMRSSANRMYLGLDQFASVVNKNSDVFSTMGGNVQDGVNRFIKLQTALMAPGSQVANNLATLGYSMEEAADLTASYMRSQGNMNKSELGDTRKTSEAVAQYAQELTVLSEITGKNRQELQKELDKQNAEAQWQSFLAQQSPEKAEKLRQAMQGAMLRGGQGAADALKAEAMGFPPMTEAARLYTATQTAGVKANENAIKAANDNSISAAENKKRQNAANAKFIAEQGKDQKKLQEVLRADALAGGKLSQSFADATALQTKFMKDGKMMSEEEIAAKLDQMDKEAEKSNSTAAAAKNAQKGMMDMTNGMLGQLMPVFKLFFDIGMKVIRALVDITPKVLNFATGLFKEVIVPAFKELFGDVSIDDIMKPIKDFVGGLFGTDSVDFKSTKDNIVGFLQPLVDLGKSLVGTIDFKQLGEDFRQVFGSLGNLLTTTSASLTTAFEEDGGIGAYFGEQFHKLMGSLSELTDGVTYVVKLIIDHPVFQTLKDMFSKLVDMVQKIVHAVVVIVKSPLGTWLIDVVLDVFKALGDIINWLIDVINDVVDGVTKMVEWFSSGHWWEDIKEGVSNFFKAIWNWLKALPGKIMDLLSTALSWYIDAVTGFWKSIWNWIKSLPSNIMKILDGGLPALWEAFKSILTSLGDGIKNLGKKLWDKATSWLPGGGDDADAKKKAEEAAAAKKKAEEEAAKKAAADKAKTTAAKPMTAAEKAAADKAKAAEEAAKKNATKIATAYIDVANIGKMNTEKRAAGGPVNPGQPYTVGEQGQELFVPKGAGQILSNSAFKSALGGVTSKQSNLVKDNPFAEIGKNVQEAVASVSKHTSSHGLTSEQGKNLIAELQTLNKQTEVLRKIALDTAEHTKKAVSATKSLNGNLFA